MWDYVNPVMCVHCDTEITGCCYPAYEGTSKIGYRHIHCHAGVRQPSDYAKPFGEVTDEDIWKGE